MYKLKEEQNLKKDPDGQDAVLDNQKTGQSAGNKQEKDATAGKDKKKDHTEKEKKP